jgi:hypothetical protein
MDPTKRVGSATDWVRELMDGDRDGFLCVGQRLPEPDEMWFNLAKRGERDKAARTAALLGLGICLGLYRDDSSTAPSNIARAHVVGVRFDGLTAAQLGKLDPRPDLAVAVGDRSWALWRTEPIDGEQMAESQRELHDDLGGDPEWDASADSWIPVPGGLYLVDDEEVEAKQLKVAKR